MLRRCAQTIHPQTTCHPGEGLSHLFYHLPSPLCALLSCTLGFNQVLWHKPRLTAGSWFSKWDLNRNIILGWLLSPAFCRYLCKDSFVAMFPLVFSQNRYFRPVGGHWLEPGGAAAAAEEPAVQPGACQPLGCECCWEGCIKQSCEVHWGSSGLWFRSCCLFSKCGILSATCSLWSHSSVLTCSWDFSFKLCLYFFF